MFTEGKEETDEIRALVSFPELPDFEWLAKVFMELGMFNTAAYSPSVILLSEITHWEYLNGVKLTGWEVCTLREMSTAYIAQLAPSAEEECPAPYSPAVAPTPELRSKVTSFLHDFVASRKKPEGAMK